ncbi:M1 family metallopeptidase [Actinocrinis puniceicyclus]|uniref:Aminopeptidase N n=1 Tax=Actinocrinis puniceicyclus TaxID=977794 RepID=A0A8J8BDZ9_9ACTN|nr:M1 family metallopeptidase [Actinocrinis puniceicyclus]MBS2963294.1 M1 family metallopeptidase [Actinocrinis puniceicyclus]
MSARAAEPARRSDGSPRYSRRTALRTLGAAAATATTAGGVAGCAAGTGTGGVPAAPWQAAETSLDPYFPGHGAGGFLVNHYALDLAYAQGAARVAGTATIRVLPYEALSVLSLDLAAGMTVLSVRADGAEASFSRQGDKLHIRPRSVLPSGRMAQLEIAYSGQPVPSRIAGVGQVGWQPTGTSGADGVHAQAGAQPGAQASAQAGADIAVLSLPVGAPTWFPCADHPSLKAAYDIAVTAPTGVRVLANGRLVDKRPQDFGTRWTYRHDGPMATYLATIVIGDLVIDTSSGPAGIQLRNAYPERLAAQARIDLGRQSQMLTVFASLFGPYPFDVYGTAVLDGVPGLTPAGPLGGAYAAQTLGLLDSSLVDGRRTQESLIARTLAAQWFGGSVTVSKWTDIWLSTAFARYAQWVWLEKSGGASADAAARAAIGRLRALAQDLVLADPGAERILDERVALRGACFLHALRLTMGDQTFFQLLRIWCNRNQSGNAQSDDFLQLVPAVYTAQDLTPFMHGWVDAAPLPDLP